MGMARVIDTDEVGVWRYDCPVCGIELARSNFETPPIDYYCPVCTTRQLPRRWSFAQPGRDLTHMEVAPVTRKERQ